LTNSGTWTTCPVSSVAAFFAPVAVSPAKPGSVWVTRRSTETGRSTPRISASWLDTNTSVFSLRNLASSPSIAALTENWSYVSLSMK
jgi:hypothetical protein